VRPFLVGLRDYIKTNKPAFGQDVLSSKKFGPEAEAMLKEAIAEYKAIFKASAN